MQSSLETKLVFLYYKTGRQTTEYLMRLARLYLLLRVNQNTHLVVKQPETPNDNNQTVLL